LIHVNQRDSLELIRGRGKMSAASKTSKKEVLMSSMKSAIAILEQESNTVTAVTGKPARPILVPKAGKATDNYVTRRVEAVLDADFTNGSMPA
jgi:hypothetical protein